MFVQREIDSPVGRLRLIASADALYAVVWSDEKLVSSLQKLFKAQTAMSMTQKTQADHLLECTIEQLFEYFHGGRHHFDLPLFIQQQNHPIASQVGTFFQRQVWSELMKIGYGETCSYSDIAQNINKINAVRAVAGAIGKNPLSIIIPCHRVIGVNGALTGFAGGLANKQKLLSGEKADFKIGLL